tara:strand:- start:12798 stop:13214 length:417 start_codon:yes stop_codon:yes gene_type:complete
MGKNIAAGIAGIAVALVLVMLAEMLGHTVYPPPADLDFDDIDAVRSHIATLPVGAFAFVAGGWFAATLAGILVACRIGTARKRFFASMITGLMLLATVYNLATIPHPLWFSIVGIAGIFLAAWLALCLSPADRETNPE